MFALRLKGKKRDARVWINGAHTFRGYFTALSCRVYSLANSSNFEHISLSAKAIKHSISPKGVIKNLGCSQQTAQCKESAHWDTPPLTLLPAVKR